MISEYVTCEYTFQRWVSERIQIDTPVLMIPAHDFAPIWNHVNPRPSWTYAKIHNNMKIVRVKYATKSEYICSQYPISCSLCNVTSRNVFGRDFNFVSLRHISWTETTSLIRQLLMIPLVYLMSVSFEERYLRHITSRIS